MIALHIVQTQWMMCKEMCIRDRFGAIEGDPEQYFTTNGAPKKENGGDTFQEGADAGEVLGQRHEGEPPII